MEELKKILNEILKEKQKQTKILRSIESRLKDKKLLYNHSEDCGNEDELERLNKGFMKVLSQYFQERISEAESDIHI